MIGQIDPKVRTVSVIGAGIAGLLAAHRLNRLGYEVTLLEASHRSGGMIGTDRTDFGMSERAANSLLATSDVVTLCDELGVELLPVNKNSRARLILRSGRPRKFPLNVRESGALVFRALFARSDGCSSTLADWSSRHLGRGATDYLLGPFVLGIFGSRPEELQTDIALPGLVVPKGRSLLGALIKRGIQQRRRAEKKERPKMVAPRDGMGQLTQALSEQLKESLGERWKVGHKVERLPSNTNVVICVPAYEAAQFFERQLSEALRSVNYAPMISATVFLDRKEVDRPPRGVGLLFPSREKRKLLGVLFSSSSFEHRVSDPTKTMALTVMMGGSLNPDLLDLGKTELAQLIYKELDRVFGLRSPPLKILFHYWPRAIPIYNSQLAATLSIASQTWCAQPGHVLFGNFTGQVSIRGMIESSTQFGSKYQNT